MANVSPLETFIDESIRVAIKAHYHPTAFIEMRKRHGTIDAIARLVVSGDIQSGFKRLEKLNLLDWSIEAAVLKFPGDFLHKKGVQECAEFRLGRVSAPDQGRL